MSNSMNRIVLRCFPSAIKVIDRFHVQKEACEAVQELRIKHRWDAIQEETDEKENAKWSGKNIIRLFFLTAIPRNSYLREVDICFLNHPKN